MLVNFPYSASRRVFARRQRRSKNGTPEERAAAQAATSAATEHVHKPRRSKNGTPEERRPLPPISFRLQQIAGNACYQERPRGQRYRPDRRGREH
jgi:hypothetical protein